MRELLTIPDFTRLHDWTGPWFMEPSAYQALRVLVFRTDLAAHIAERRSRMFDDDHKEKAADTLTEILPAKGGRNIAKIALTGTLMKSQSSFGGTSTVQARREINAAANDSTVQGILLAIDSPGGTVAGTAELGDTIKSAARQKPVYAWVDGLAASAAYWAASQADMIYAGNRMAQVGSIGTYFPAYDVSKQFEADGIKTHLFTTGPFKGMGVEGTAITEEQAAHLQERVNGMQAHFDTAVRTGRGLSATELTAVRSGAVYPATEALDRRLIDGTKTLEQTLAALAAAS